MTGAATLFRIDAAAWCALCRKGIDDGLCRGRDGRPYCSPFCAADADTRETPMQRLRSVS
jgi:hypothetical protein